MRMRLTPCSQQTGYSNQDVGILSPCVVDTYVSVGLWYWLGRHIPYLRGNDAIRNLIAGATHAFSMLGCLSFAIEQHVCNHTHAASETFCGLAHLQQHRS